MKDRKEYILEKAFDVFMSHGYDSASITVLQKELGMSRGIMYRYFKSKDELFIAVIDKYVIGLINRFKLQAVEDMTLIEMIEHRYRYHKRVMIALDKQNLKLRFLNFTALIIQAAKHYPGFIEQTEMIKAENLKLWKKAILNSLEKDEIRGDVRVDIIAGLFSSGSTNPEIEMADYDREKNFSQHAEIWKRDMEYLYSLIKK
ncbi:MAG: TetR/AcrR family transcriptional regulator [Bacteroidales bacterium]|jgi:AcrR family transcriptional regulator|nr:TetR/AcrR family transcriptional regulator [Bacteroidales bacterium]